MATEDQRQEAQQECLYKTKVVQFFGRTTPIILQNDNGPCPLLAICNILLLKNSLNLNVDACEVSQQKLLSLVAERLIDSNSNVEKKEAGYVENQQQNIADAIDLLPRLATGIDVNVQFRRIDDFEFTRECAIFDLLDIPLCHGWIVDPQDCATANAIGSKSYNTLMGELVALETKNSEYKINSEEDSIDFAAATAATLGVPSPCLSRGISFDESPCAVSGHQEVKKGDLEEQAELLRVLKLSEAEVLTSVDESPSADTSGANRSAIVEETEHLQSNGSEFLSDALGRHIGDKHEVRHLSKPSVTSTCTSTSNPESDEFSGSSQHIDQPSSVASSLDGSEPIYEGEECILDSGLTIYESREPMYEGEMVLAEQADNGARDGSVMHPRDEITQQKGELIKNFLRNNASQLTVYGLFCLQEGLKEKELCVFFRNNHFSTIFKFNGGLYLLATDQGYINQPDLVWEKLNEVNGDTVFMTGNFEEFKVENHVNDEWDEQNAVACAADYIASIDNSATEGSTLKIRGWI